METVRYDINVQLALATTARQEGDFDSALEFIYEARRLAREAADQSKWMFQMPE